MKGCTIEAELPIVISQIEARFSCCWKDVRLKLDIGNIERNSAGVSVVVERMYDWSIQELFRVPEIHNVSVVVERMYDWSAALSCTLEKIRSFSCCWKDVRLKQIVVFWRYVDYYVSVVVERMYDWSQSSRRGSIWGSAFQLLLKGCTIEAGNAISYYGNDLGFSCCWKDVRLKLNWGGMMLFDRSVSVVVERMYDWSSETNWLKTNDFWQLVSGLFFENGRSAQKVPLFSKIWGDCLTVFDSCGNI